MGLFSFGGRAFVAFIITINRLHPLRYATSLPNVENVVYIICINVFDLHSCVRVCSRRIIRNESRGGFSHARLSATYTITLPKLFKYISYRALAKLRLRETRFLILKWESLVSRLTKHAFVREPALAISFLSFANYFSQVKRM